MPRCIAKYSGAPSGRQRWRPTIHGAHGKHVLQELPDLTVAAGNVIGVELREGKGEPLAVHAGAGQARHDTRAVERVILANALRLVGAAEQVGKHFVFAKERAKGHDRAWECLEVGCPRLGVGQVLVTPGEDRNLTAHRKHIRYYN